jgi:antitoxin ParD1/3/4
MAEGNPMNVSLTPELEVMVNEKVKSGLYTSASEVIREALRLLRRFDETRQRELEELNRQIDEGLAQAKRGQVIGGKESRRRARAVLARHS